MLVLGGGGMLAAAVAQEVSRRGGQVDAPSRAELDITDTAAVEDRLHRSRASLVVNAAAYTDVDGCEENRDHALEVNGLAVSRLAEVTGDAGVGLVHISSDFVFDGAARSPYLEHDPPAPLSVYGESKLAGERAALLAVDSLVVRTSWLFGPGGGNFVDTILRLASERDELRVVNDQRGAPTYTPHLAVALLDLVDRESRGIVHYRDREAATWFDFACAILEEWGLTTKITPVTTQEYPRPARRPAYSVLDIEHYESLVGQSAKAWREGLSAYHHLVGRLDE